MQILTGITPFLVVFFSRRDRRAARPRGCRRLSRAQPLPACPRRNAPRALLPWACPQPRRPASPVRRAVGRPSEGWLDGPVITRETSVVIIGGGPGVMRRRSSRPSSGRRSRSSRRTASAARPSSPTASPARPSSRPPTTCPTSRPRRGSVCGCRTTTVTRCPTPSPRRTPSTTASSSSPPLRAPISRGASRRSASPCCAAPPGSSAASASSPSSRTGRRRSSPRTSSSSPPALHLASWTPCGRTASAS